MDTPQLRESHIYTRREELARGLKSLKWLEIGTALVGIKALNTVNAAMLEVISRSDLYKSFVW